MDQQRHDHGCRFRRRAEPIEDRAFGGTEGLLALFAEKALLLLRVNTHVALADLASGVAIEIGTEYGGGVHFSRN